MRRLLSVMGTKAKSRHSSFFLAVLFFSLLALSGCGGGGTNSDSSEADTQSDAASINTYDAIAIESTALVEIQFELSAAATDTVSVDYTFQSGTAIAGEDYIAVSGELQFAAGETSKSISVAIIDDSTAEDSETFSLQLSDPHGGTLLNKTVLVTIIDDDSLLSEIEFDPHWGPTGAFTDADTCAQCHRASSDSDPSVPTVMRYPLVDTGEDVSPSHDWQHSVMAHAFNDPYFQAAMREETHVFPHLAGFIEDTCLTCHAPMGRTHAHVSDTSLLDGDACMLPDGCYRFEQARHDMHAREGVSCTLCHQVQDSALGTDSAFSGAYTIDAGLKTIFGPYANPHSGGANAMQTQSGYEPQHGTHMSSSAMCATCHTLFTPTIDVDTGLPTGEKFLEQGPYLEWENSIFAEGEPGSRSCQSCHMPDPEPGTYATRIAVKPNGDVNEMWPQREPFARHQQVGGNTHLLGLLKKYRALLGIDGITSEAGFEEQIDRAQALLQEAVDLTVDGVNMQDGQLQIDITVHNRTGHKLPTGYPSRRMWLHMRITDDTGRTVFDSGAPDSRGRLQIDANNASTACMVIDKPDDFANDSCFEPHRDRITSEAQVAVWQSVLADTNGHITHVLLHADEYLKDNRIPPQGFVKSRQHPDTANVGIGDDADFNASGGIEGSGTDTVHYFVALPPGRYQIHARLLYQSIRPSFVESLHGVDDPVVARFRVMYADTPPTVEVLATRNVEYRF